MQAFIDRRRGHNRQGRTVANRYNTGKTKSKQGQAWVFDRRTVSNRARQREIIQVHSNNPGRGKHNPKQARQDQD